MITSAYVRMMAAYNGEMNRRLFAAAAQLSDAERRLDRGLFWKSLHGTLNHLLWADRIWMSRFDGWPPPEVGTAHSATMIAAFDDLQAARIEADAAIEAFAARVDDDWLAGDLVWFSGAAGMQMRRGRGALLAHLFNHQTHHRGQAHAALTMCGVDPGVTDLFLVVADA